MNTKQAEYKTDIGTLAADLRVDISNLAAKSEADLGKLAEKMAQRDTRLLLWTMGIVTGAVAIGVAILGVLIRWPVAG